MEENKSIRIRTNINEDKFIKVNLNQTFDTLNILSLKLRQEDVYRNMCSDYGMICGRVSTKSFGIPNTKISIFIPLSEEDENNQLITSLYPFKIVTDKNEQKIIYNLLPKFKQNGSHQPVGSFPPKREILDNDLVLEIYEKYYKFTTITNSSGDYMIMGIPIGTHTVHMDIDFSDIGFASSKPHELIANGYPENLFESPSKFKRSSNLNELAQIVTQNKSINILPFWGDLEQCEVGITRTDFDIQNFEIIPSAIFFGSIFTDPGHNYVDITGEAKRKPMWEDKHCSIHPAAGKGLIEIITKTEDDNIENLNSQVIESNNWAISIPMNKNRVITDEFGNLTQPIDKTKGIPTEIDIRFKISSTQPSTAHHLIPNMTNNFNWDKNGEFFTMKWKRAYTVRQYIARHQHISNDKTVRYVGIHRVNECPWSLEFPYNRASTFLTGQIPPLGSERYPLDITLNYDDIELAIRSTIGTLEYRTSYEFYNNWINGSLYFLRFEHDNFFNFSSAYSAYILDKSGFTENYPSNSNIHGRNRGLFKKIGDEFFYMSTGNEGSNVGCYELLYATNITDLGNSINDVDNNNITAAPFIFDKLVRTTYQSPLNAEKVFYDYSQSQTIPVINGSQTFFVGKVTNHDLITRTCEIGNKIIIDDILNVTETMDVDLRRDLCNLNTGKHLCDGTKVGIYTQPTYNIDGTQSGPDSCTSIKRLFNIDGSSSLFSFYFYFGMNFDNSLDLVKQKFLS